MATFRVGVGSFNIQDGAVGFGTEIDGLGNLRVKGVTKTTGSIVSGASTLTRYSGFAADNINQLENITLTSEVGTIGDIVVGVGTSVIISSASTVTVGTVESVSIGTHFSPPVGGIEDRGEDFVEGMMRFNTDLNTMEFYNGNEWRQFNYQSDIRNSPGSRGRCLRLGGQAGNTPHARSIGFVNIHTTGNEMSFGDLNNVVDGSSAVSSSIRAVNLAGSANPGGSAINVMDYVTMASEGNAEDFGDLNQKARYPASASNGTRGLCMSGQEPSYTTMINLINISTLGNAIDTGGEFTGAASLSMTVYSPVRMIIAGGYSTSSPTVAPSVDFISITSTGDAVQFGELHERSGAGFSNSVRGIIGGGYNGGSNGGMKHISIASLGEYREFGDMTFDNRFAAGNGNAASKTRGLFVGGGTPSSPYTNIIDFVEISSLGDAQDFGDLTGTDLSGSNNLNSTATISDCHGGLGGY